MQKSQWAQRVKAEYDDLIKEIEEPGRSNALIYFYSSASNNEIHWFLVEEIAKQGGYVTGVEFNQKSVQIDWEIPRMGY